VDAGAILLHAVSVSWPQSCNGWIRYLYHHHLFNPRLQPFTLLLSIQRTICGLKLPCYVLHLIFLTYAKLPLLKALRGQVPPTWTVIVLADRGWYAKGLFEGLQGLGWHPLLRVNAKGTFRPRPAGFTATR